MESTNSHIATNVEMQAWNILIRDSIESGKMADSKQPKPQMVRLWITSVCNQIRIRHAETVHFQYRVDTLLPKAGPS